MSRPASPIRVVVFNDSPTMRVAIRQALHRTPDIRVVAEAQDGQDAVAVVRRAAPSLVLMDVHMPGVDGYSATKAIMADNPLPIVMLSSIANPRDANVVFETLAAGALCIAEAPPSPADANFERSSGALAQLIRAMVQARPSVLPKGPQAPQHEQVRVLGTSVQMIGIVASTGGPSAIAQILSDLPAGIPPIVIVQHLASGFTASFAQWLQERTGYTTRVPTDGERLEPGVVYIAPDGLQLGLYNAHRARLSHEPSVSLFMPSGDYLLTDIARVCGARGLGVVLTGMGEDGALGAKRLRQAKAAVAAQDEASSVVFGMPRTAIELEAVSEVLPLRAIAHWISTKSGVSR